MNTLKLNFESTKNKYKIIVGTLLLVFFFAEQATAQNYLQSRLGYLTGRYRALNKDLLDREEHDFTGGALLNIEYGREFGNKRITFLLGARLEHSIRILKGTYTHTTWDPDVDITAHISACFITVGAKTALTNKLNLLVQAGIGPSYIKWYNNGVHVNSLWRFYPPIDVSIEYALSDQWHLQGGVSTIPPIYFSTATSYFFGFRKEF